MAHSLKMILLAGVFGAAAVLPAAAQDNGYDRDGYSAYNGDEEVIVHAPRHYRQDRSAIGAPIENVALSEPVRFDDLNLESDRDVRRLESRVHARARALCRRLEVAHPIDVSDTPQTCYRDAVADAMDQVEAAVGQARGYDGDNARRDTFINPPPPRQDRDNAGDDDGY